MHAQVGGSHPTAAICRIPVVVNTSPLQLSADADVQSMWNSADAAAHTLWTVQPMQLFSAQPLQPSTDADAMQCELLSTWCSTVSNGIIP